MFIIQFLLLQVACPLLSICWIDKNVGFIKTANNVHIAGSLKLVSYYFCVCFLWTQVILAQCVVYLSRAPKSVEILDAYGKAKSCVRHHKGPLPSVPLHLRNAPTKLMKNLGEITTLLQFICQQKRKRNMSETKEYDQKIISKRSYHKIIKIFSMSNNI